MKIEDKFAQLDESDEGGILYNHNEEDCAKIVKEIAIKFAIWLRDNDTQENADEWCNYSDEDMFNYFVENVL